MPSELLPDLPHIRRTVTQADGHGVAKLRNGAEAFPAGQFFDFERWDCEHCPNGFLMIRLYSPEPEFLKKDREAWLERHRGCGKFLPGGPAGL